MWNSHSEYEALGNNAQERQTAYRNQFKAELGQDVLDDIRLPVGTGFVLGNERFRQQVEDLSGFAQRFQQRGRPPVARDV